MGQDRDAAMGLSVKAMIFFEAKLLLLRKNDGKTFSPLEFTPVRSPRDENFLVRLYRFVNVPSRLTVLVVVLAGPLQYRTLPCQSL